MGTITIAEIYAGLQYAGGQKWPGSSLSYSIPGPGPSFWASGSYDPTDEPYDTKFGVLNAEQRTAFINAVGAWERVINFDLFEVPDNADSQGQIRIAFTHTSSHSEGDPAAYAYRPPSPGGVISAFNGDIWIDDQYKTDDPSPGDFLFETFLHELGHALGLKHPFEGASLPAEFENTRYTVMSYTDFLDSGFRYFELSGSGSLVASTFTVVPATPMQLDIIALQGIYGAATNVDIGANTYTIDESLPFMATILDQGGIDTFDLSTHKRASNINLTPGAFSSIDVFSIPQQIAFWQAAFPNFSRDFIANYLNKPSTYTWSNNLATTTDTVIENVRAGSGDDTIMGNAAANSLSGGAGSDQIFGSSGNDTIDGGSAGPAGNYLRGDDGNDSLLGGANFDDINGNQGNDTVSTGAGDDYCVGGKDNDLLFGGSGVDYVYGNLGDDTCNGDDGNDIVRGGQGNDVVNGGAGDDFVSGDKGDDTMSGGAGADLFHTFSDAGIDRVLDFSVAQGDRVLLDPGTQFTVMQVGGDTVIMMNAGQMVLVGIQMSSLPPGTIFGA